MQPTYIQQQAQYGSQQGVYNQPSVGRHGPMPSSHGPPNPAGSPPHGMPMSQMAPPQPPNASFGPQRMMPGPMTGQVPPTAGSCPPSAAVSPGVPLPSQYPQYANRNMPGTEYGAPAVNDVTGQLRSMQLNGDQQNPNIPVSPQNQVGPVYPSTPAYSPVNGSGDIVNGGTRKPPKFPQDPQGHPLSGERWNYGASPNYPPGRFPQQQATMRQPNQPGYSQPPFPAAQPSYPQYQQQQPRRLDPEDMPSPMQVMLDDQELKSGRFCTVNKGEVPPLVTTDFTVIDQGNASPRFVRSTMYSVPVTADLMKQASVPFGLVISPMADVGDYENIPPVVDMGELGPVRCSRCKAYMSPQMQFIDGGRRFQCLLCKVSTEVPAEYFQHLDHTGMRLDRFQRPELCLGAYDYIATKDYCTGNEFPKPPAIIFVIDVSYNNIKSGLVHLLCGQMKHLLQCLPRENDQEQTKMKVGFITYNKSVHFYNISPNLAQPQMMVVGDVNDMFMPLLEGFLVDPVESEAVIDTLMDQIPKLFADTRETEIVLLPAIQAGLEALKASGTCGKLFVFHSSLPIFDAPGKLKNRDDRKVLGTEKEKSVLSPQNSAYNNLGQDCVAAGCSVDMFIFNNTYVDLATIGQISRLTGGDIYKYTYFQAYLDGGRVIADVERTLSRLRAFDAIMRIRTSSGIRPTDFYGHFFMSNATDIELAAINPDKAVAVEIKHDDKLSEDEGVFIQIALLYTSITGVRKIRVLNLSLKACSQMCDLYRTCELDTLINFFSKQALTRMADGSPKSVKEGLVSRSAQILACYRKNCATPSSSSQLVLPECLKLLPLYINCLLKSDALSGGSEMTVDDRWFMIAAVMTMDIPTSVVYFYPRLVSLHELNEDKDSAPIQLRCSMDKLAEHGAYLLYNGIYMFLWLGQSLSSDWVISVFGVPSVAQVSTERNVAYDVNASGEASISPDNPEKSLLPALNNPISKKIRSYIEAINASNPRSIRLTIVRQQDKLELVMKHFLVEDSGLDKSSASYVDFLCHMHKEIRDLLTS